MSDVRRISIVRIPDWFSCTAALIVNDKGVSTNGAVEQRLFPFFAVNRG